LLRFLCWYSWQQAALVNLNPRLTTYQVFGSGLLHGFLIFFSFIGSLFTNVRIYAFPNSGVWYDFGYLIGASMFLGGAGASVD
jgi:hypothetical protein